MSNPRDKAEPTQHMTEVFSSSFGKPESLKHMFIAGRNSLESLKVSGQKAGQKNPSCRMGVSSGW